MANPVEGNVHKASGGGAALNGAARAKLPVEEAERWAAKFRPSWEAGSVGLDPLENGTYASERPHAPPPRTDVHEPENSVIIDRSITAADLDGSRIPSAPPAPKIAQAPAEPIPLHKKTSNRPPPRAPEPPPAPRARPVVAEAADPIDLPVSRPKKGVLVMLAVAGVVVVAGISIGIAMSGSSEPQATATTKSETPKASTAKANATAAAAKPEAPKPEATAKPEPPKPEATAKSEPPKPEATAKPEPAATTAPEPKSAPAPEPPTTKAASRTRPAYNTTTNAGAVAQPPPAPHPTRATAPPARGGSEIVKKPDF